MTQRTAWIDVAKGIAIILVVIGHAWRGLATADLVSDHLFLAVDRRIYAFHMPVFFALSGWFYEKSLIRTAPMRFLQSRLTRLFWPMVLWTYLFLGVKWVGNARVNTPVSLQDLVVLPVPGILHLWFLWALLLLHLVLIPLRPFLGMDSPHSLRIIAGLMAVSLAASVVPLSEVVDHWAGPAIRHTPFFVLGIILARLPPLQNLSAPYSLAALLVFCVLLTIWPQMMRSSPQLLRLTLALVLTICFLVIMAKVVRVAPRLSEWIGQLGVLSMAIFLTHTIFSASLRIALVSFDVTSLSVHLATGVAIGLAGPLVLAKLSQKTGTARYFGF